MSRPVHASGEPRHVPLHVLTPVPVTCRHQDSKLQQVRSAQEWRRMKRKAAQEERRYLEKQVMEVLPSLSACSSLA